MASCVFPSTHTRRARAEVEDDECEFEAQDFLAVDHQHTRVREIHNVFSGDGIEPSVFPSSTHEQLNLSRSKCYCARIPVSRQQLCAELNTTNFFLFFLGNESRRRLCKREIQKKKSREMSRCLTLVCCCVLHEISIFRLQHDYMQHGMLGVWRRS